MDNTFGLSEKTVLLTGTSSSVGRAIALRLSEAGANVALVDKNEERTNRLVNEIMDQRETRDSYGRAAAIVSDVSKSHHVKEAVSNVAQAFGGIDIYIDALFASRDMPISEGGVTEELDRLIDLNTKAPYLITHEVVKFLKERRRSRIVYLTPDLASWGAEGESVAAITRTGLSHLAKVVAREHSTTTMTANCVAVGPTDDYLVTRAPNSSSAESALNLLTDKNAYVQMGDPNEIANVVVFLASGLSGAINGQTLIASHGLT